jgi:predicted nucleic acid-binding protein
VARSFFDTNVVLYLLSAERRKADTAEALLTQGGVVSVQVLNEAASVCRRKLGLSWDEVRELLAAVRACCEVVPLDIDTHTQGLELAERHGLSIYDALIVASAVRAGAETLYSEDMHHGLAVGGTTICNPFA